MDTPEKIIGLITAMIALVGAIITLLVTLIKKHKRNELGGEVMQSLTGNNSSNQPVNIHTKGSGNKIDVKINQESFEQKPEYEPDKNKLSTDITLASEYTSIFAEDNMLKTESIKITKRDKDQIEGEVYLNEHIPKKGTIIKYKYKMVGTFSNRVLTADYYSSDSTDERGVINLKMIDNKILSGFCSFSKLSAAADEIRMSPYVWVQGASTEEILNGTFKFCTDCYINHKECCCSSDMVDMPIFADTEIDAIRTQMSKKNMSKETFSVSLHDPYENSTIRQIKRVVDNPEDHPEGRCHFFDTVDNRCRIYAGRPIDCRLFPFDIRLDETKSQYMIVYYSALCDKVLPEYSEMKKYAHILRPYFFLMYPYLHIITDDYVCAKLKNAEYRKIAYFKDFVF